MKRTLLNLRQAVTLPVEAESISPDQIDGLSQSEIEALPLLWGRRKRVVGDLFEVTGSGTPEIEIRGDLSHIKRIGQAMTRGRITIQGSVGLHLGSGMRGGQILVQGDAGAWAGAQIAGGTLRVQGNAGPMLGGAYTGQTRGMRGGTIIVGGSAAGRVGERMRRGLIVIQGDSGEMAGVRMIAGTIVVLGTLGPRAGAGMKRGTILALGGLAGDPLPTFRYACSYQPSFLRCYLRHLKSMSLPIEERHMDATYERYTGDINTIGKGEILVYA